MEHVLLGISASKQSVSVKQGSFSALGKFGFPGIEHLFSAQSPPKPHGFVPATHTPPSHVSTPLQVSAATAANADPTTLGFEQSAAPAHA